MTPAIERAGFVRSTGNTVWWGSSEPRVEMFQPGALGWQADLQQLSDGMRADVANHLVRVTDSSAVDATNHHAALVLDCTGRTGVIAKAKDVREYEPGPRTIALVAEWRTGPSWSVPDDTHTVIESYGDGWLWSVPIARGVRHVSAMVDPQRSGLARAGSARQVYLTEISKSEQFKRLLADAALIGGPWGWDATPYRAREYAGDNWLLVGDAASFIDPLSSAGVKKALASAWLAAVVAYTCVRQPSMRPHALTFFAAREREIERRYSDAARAFITEAAREHRHAFWADRAVEPASEESDSDAAQQAFEHLRAATEVRLRASPAIAVAPRPYIEGREIVLGPHIVTADDDPGTRYLYNVDLPRLFELAPASSQVADLFAAYTAHLGHVDLHDFLRALASAVARGWLVRQ